MKSIKMQENKVKCYMWHEYENTTSQKSSFYKNMFIQDVVTGFFPIKLNHDEDDIQAIIEGEDKELDILKSILNSFNRNSESYDENTLVKYAIEGIAQEIAWSGDAIYEIYRENDKEIKFINLISSKFINLYFFYIQLPPKNKPLAYKFINKKSIWKISIPKSLQKKYSYRSILSSIDKFDSIMPKAFKNDLYNGSNSYFNYDSTKYKEKQFVYINNLTSEWGWNQRSMSDDVTTEFFKNYKYLKFHLAQAIYREHILNELNNLFKSINLKISIRLEGVASSKDHEEHIKKYLKNEVGYEEIFDINKEKNG